MSEAVGLNSAVHKRYEDRTFMSRLDSTLAVRDADPARYDAIYMTGGHGVMFDFPASTALADSTARFYEAGKIVSAVCHGPCGLLEVRLKDGKHLVNGKKLRAFSPETYPADGAVVMAMTRPKSLALCCIHWICCC